jgi:hypothetical protein
LFITRGWQYAVPDGYSSKYVVVLEHCLSREDDSMLGQMVALVSMLLY